MKKIFLVIVVAANVLACDRRPAANFENGAPALMKSAFVPNSPVKPEFVSARYVERKLIKNGTIEFSTDNVADMRNQIGKIVTDFNAYISSDNQENSGGQIQYEQVIRIPASRFDPFVKMIEKLGTEIQFREVATQDVTEQYVDLEARLKTKKELEIRYLHLLSKAKNVKEMLEVEEQIASVRSEIESMQGRINLLADQVSLSTLTVRYYQVVEAPRGFGSKLMTSFAGGWNGLLVFLVGVVSVWPFILILALTLWLISRWSKRVNLRLRKSEQAS